jgi:hypothetical protein
MDAVTELKVQTVLALAGAPLLTLGAVLSVGLWGARRASQPARPALLAAALALALAVAWGGLVGYPTAFPPVDRKLWVPALALAVPALFALVDRSSKADRLAVIAPLAALTLLGSAILVFAPILGGEYAPGDRVGFGAALALAAWLSLDRASRALPAPPALAAVCFSALGAALAAAMAGTAIMGQALGGVACVSGVASIIAWRVPRLTLGAAGVAALLTPYLATVAIATLYGELPVTAAALFLIAPIGAATALFARSVVPATLLAALTAAVIAAGGVALTRQAETAKAAQAAPAEPAIGNPTSYDQL